MKTLSNVSKNDGFVSKNTNKSLAQAYFAQLPASHFRVGNQEHQPGTGLLQKDPQRLGYRIVNTFQYGDSGKTQGTDLITETEVLLHRNQTEEGHPLYEMRETRVTTLYVDAQGKVKGEALRRIFHTTEIFEAGGGPSLTSGATHQTISKFDVSKELYACAQTVAAFKKEHKISPLQQKARDNDDNVEIARNVSGGLSFLAGVAPMIHPSPITKVAGVAVRNIGGAVVTATLITNPNDPEQLQIKMK